MKKNKQEELKAEDIGSAPARKEFKKKNVEAKPAIPASGLFGLGLFFVAVSILYANYMTFFGMDFSWVNVALLTPSSVFVVCVMVYKFIK